MTFEPEKAREFARRHSMFAAETHVVALVSGGADSTALLRLLAAGSLGEFASLTVLHVNHLLRERESDADEAFVVELCEDLGVRCRAVRYDVAAHAEAEALNLEDAGRRIRYRFAEEELDAILDVADARHEDGRIAVAHTLDDRIETFFMRVLAGAGGGGLASIAPVRGRIVRPLLGSKRDELRVWLQTLRQGWCEDASNLDLTRLRALIRHELLPDAEAINARYAENLERTMELLGEEDALLQEMAEAFAHDFVEMRGRDIAFLRQPMLTLSRPMARRTIRTALLRTYPDASRIEFEHIEALVDGLAENSFARDLPYGLRAFSEYDTMMVTRVGEEPEGVAPALLPIPGTADLGSGGRITAEEVGAGDVRGTDRTVVIDATDVEGDLVVDSVRPGDRMQPFGMEGTRKLSDLLVDAKVPVRERRRVPVVRDGERIVWLAGVRMSEAYRVGPGTRRRVRLIWDPQA